MKKILLLFFVAMLVLHIKTIYAQVTYTLGNTDYYTTYASGGGIFANSGTSELGMWAHYDSKEVVAWRNLKTAGDNTGTTRSLQVGDVFTISVYATAAYGQMGFSLNANASTGSWANRHSNSRLYIQAEGTSGSWYVSHGADNTTLNYPVSTTGHTYQFKVFITSLSTCNVEFYVDGGFHSRLMNLTLKGTAGANIDGFSLYLKDDWNGSANSNIYWKQITAHQALGYVDLGYYLTSGTFTPGLVQNGLESNSTVTSNTNYINIGGDAGTYVILNQTNTYSGSTTVNTNARLELQNIAALGSSSGVTVQNNAAISLYNATGLSYNTYTTILNGGGVGGANGALRSTGGNNTWPGGITLASSSRINADASGAAGSLTLSGAVTLTSNTLTIGGSTSGVTISGKISGAGVLAKDGTNTLSLSNATNDYSGGTVLTAGTISFANNAVLGTGDLTFGSGTTTCTFDVIDNTSRSGTIKVVEASTAGVINVADGKTFTLNGAITSTGTNAATKFGKSGSGTFIVNANGSSYPGQIQIGNGIVIVQNNGGLGTNITTANRGIDLGLNVGDVSQANNVSVLATDGITVPQSIYVAPNTSNATRTIGLSGSGSAIFNNEIYLDGSLIANGGSGTVTLSGNLIHTGGLISSGGIVILSGAANTFSGATTITAGTLELRSNIASSAVTVQNGATLKINGSNVTVASLTVIEGGVVNIEPGASLTVTGTLTNNAGNTGIVIKSDASGTGSLINSSTGVEATVERYLTKYDNISDKKYHFISSPVNVQPIFADLTDFYRFSEITNYWINRTSTGDPEAFGDVNFVVGRGYLVADDEDVTKLFNTGTLNTYPSTSALVLTGTNTPGKGNGWNLIGNPFPSAIDWDAVALGNGMDNALYYYDASIENYRYYIHLEGEVGAVGSGSRYIPAMQGFMVHAKTSGTQTITIDNDDRVHQAQTVFYKTAATIPGSLSLKVTADGYEDVAFIHFNNAATAQFDGDYDAYKLKSYSVNVPMVYTKAIDGSELAINGLPELSETTNIPVYLEYKTAGTYTFTADLSGISGTLVFLNDLKENTSVNLTQNPAYQFTVAEGDAAERFSLTFGSVGIEDTEQEPAALVYAVDKTIFIVGAEKDAQLILTDISGKMLKQVTTSGESRVSINAASLPKGVYIVTVQGEGARVSRKVVL